MQTPIKRINPPFILNSAPISLRMAQRPQKDAAQIRAEFMEKKKQLDADIEACFQKLERFVGDGPVYTEADKAFASLSKGLRAMTKDLMSKALTEKQIDKLICALEDGIDTFITNDDKAQHALDGK